MSYNILFNASVISRRFRWVKSLGSGAQTKTKMRKRPICIHYKKKKLRLALCAKNPKFSLSHFSDFISPQMRQLCRYDKLFIFLPSYVRSAEAMNLPLLFILIVRDIFILACLIYKRLVFAIGLHKNKKFLIYVI